MDGTSTSTSATDLRTIEPASDLFQKSLSSIVALHGQLLPLSAASRAGPKSLAQLYCAVATEGAGFVVSADGWGFASATVDLRGTEARLRKFLSFRSVVRLACAALASPSHLLSRRAWESQIPRQYIGYILTIGVQHSTEAPPEAGAKILTYLETRFRQAGCIEAWVDTEDKNQRAVRFYKKHGYELVSRRFGHCLFRKRI